jgi:hypothetical protein
MLLGVLPPMNIKNFMNMKKSRHIHIYDLIYLTVFIILGTIGRTILVGGNLQPFPNFEIIMVLTFLAAMITKPYLAFFVPLISMIASDFLLGNPIFVGSQMNKIILFTYSGFIMISLICIITRRKTIPRFQQLRLQNIAVSAGIGIGFALIYDVWTNTGWWFLMYPHTLESFIAVFIAGIPFMIYHMISATLTFTLIGLPVLFMMTQKKQLSLPAQLPSAQKMALIAVTGLFITLSFTGSAVQIPHHSEIWLEDAEQTSITLTIEGNDWTVKDSITTVKSTTVLSVLERVCERNSIEIDTMYYTDFDSTLITSLNGDENGENDYYWQYYVNDELPMVGCDVYQVSNGDSILWRFENV